MKQNYLNSDRYGLKKVTKCYKTYPLNDRLIFKVIIEKYYFFCPAFTRKINITNKCIAIPLNHKSCKESELLDKESLSYKIKPLKILIKKY